VISVNDERRTVLKVLAGCAGAGVVAAAAVPAIALVAEPATEGGGGEGGWTRLLRLEALEPGQPAKAVVIGAEQDAWTRAPDRRIGTVGLVRDAGAAVHAYSAVCPHLGCAIEHEADHFVCRCHDSVFDLHGAARTGPSPRGMDPLEVRVADGW